MLPTHNSRNRIKHLLALTIAIGLASWPMLPSKSVGRLGPLIARDTAHTPAQAQPPVSVNTSTAPDEATRARARKAYGQLPLSFEANQGQTDAQVRFLARGSGYSLFLTSTEAILSLKSRESEVSTSQESQAQTPDSRLQTSHPAVLRMQLLGANPQPQVTGMEKRAGKIHYFIGSDPEKWRTNVAHYGKVKYAAVYRGVDLVYYGKGRQLEYDFVVAAGADPGVIKLSFGGAKQVRIDEGGDLVVSIADGELRQPKPLVYQDVGGVRTEIASHYVLRQTPNYRPQTPDSFAVGIEVESYDASRELVIDPVLVYSTYLGGDFGDQGLGIAVDGKGNAYVTGQTDSLNFPTQDAFQSMNAGSTDAFVTKFSHDGEELVYSTYLGGSSADRGGNGIAVDEDGQAYVTGETDSLNFPTTRGAFQRTFRGSGDAYVTKLNRKGSALVYSTYLGGTSLDQGLAIALDEDGQAYVTGTTISTDFPTRAAAFPIDPFLGGDAFVTKLNHKGSALIYSSYLGGDDGDRGHGIAVDEDGQAYVTGRTESNNFPTTAGTFQPIDPSTNCNTAFVTKFSRRGSALVYSTYLGGLDEDEGSGIAVDEDGQAYVTGLTDSSNFPTTPGAFQVINAGPDDAFVTKLNRRGTALVYSTYLGGTSSDEGFAIALDEDGHAYVTGRTRSVDFPTTADAFQNMNAGSDDVFVTKLNRRGTALVYSTYLGGTSSDEGFAIAVARKGNAYVTGLTESGNFPTTSGAFDTTYNGFDDAFVAKIEEDD